ncbi:hypothetical protein ACQP1V_05895 [Microtetraspora malaysiensis]|uniref:hypothetical protein n=1 Tax=Microtetraspora malaysiensis TaxID=161358 RepID=UPI003D8E9A8D
MQGGQVEEPPRFTSKGVPVSEERIERLAAEAEEGYDASVIRSRAMSAGRDHA